MNRIVVLVAATVGLVAAACGSAAGAANTASTSPSPGRGAQFRNGASGQLVQVNGQSLILTGASGDTTVTMTTTTTFTRTSTAVLADIVPGLCILASGQKDSAGMLTATTVRLSPMTSSGCAAPGRPGPNPSPGASPRPIPSGQPAPAPLPVVSGEVTSALGISITVMTAGSGSQTITVPTVATVTRTLPASSTDLRTGECLRANGPMDSSGGVQATSIAITPPGPSGTCTTGFGGGGGGRGGFGRGGGTPGAGTPSN
jgi:Domain of unknown function (DUF5666)